jgi:crossover junction endodeoxyribonuclease RuvC
VVQDWPRILGIDPGSRIIGFSLLSAKKARPLSPRDWHVEDVGVLKFSSQANMFERLGEVHCGIFDLIKELNPTEVAIEKAFYGINPSTAIKLGEARGAILSAVARAGLVLTEITPAEVKRSIAGHGSADKERVYLALKSILGFDRGQLPHDASDALAIALTASMMRKMSSWQSKNSKSLKRKLCPEL